jgi:hypothetical protein
MGIFGEVAVELKATYKQIVETTCVKEGLDELHKIDAKLLKLGADTEAFYVFTDTDLTAAWTWKEKFDEIAKALEDFLLEIKRTL